ncbi:hypothetical protein CWE15_04420 [Aliidiomarina taiwanensis]|uniref:Uncharacterized protein n=2 Tax=Aliidiomarina taiwanensis TaxID=946228 RepID=A0A432X731_9GAMM|nr:hypothetical protein CWE15_04420 [Aliidiomarina taiwanensis]
MTDSEEIRELYNVSSAVYLDGNVLYFALSEGNSLPFSKTISDQLGIRKENSSTTSIPELKQLRDHDIYSYEKTSQSILSIEVFLNQDLHNHLEKLEDGTYRINIGDMLLFYVNSDSKRLTLLQNKKEIFDRIEALYNLLDSISSYTSKESPSSFWINSATSEGHSFSRVVRFSFSDEFIQQVIKGSLHFDIPELSSTGIHQHEKKVLFKRALTSALGEYDQDEGEAISAGRLALKMEHIHSKYNGEYAAYINKFGLDKCLNELNDKAIEIIGKVYQAMHGAVLKLLVVPATVVATLMIRQANIPEGNIVFLAMLVITLIWSSNYETRAYVKQLKENGEHLLESIIRINNQESTTYNKAEQDEVIQKFKLDVQGTLKRISRYRNASITALVAWIVFLYKPFLLDFTRCIVELLPKLPPTNFFGFALA